MFEKLKSKLHNGERIKGAIRTVGHGTEEVATSVARGTGRVIGTAVREYKENREEKKAKEKTEEEPEFTETVMEEPRTKIIYVERRDKPRPSTASRVVKTLSRVRIRRPEDVLGNQLFTPRKTKRAILTPPPAFRELERGMGSMSARGKPTSLKVMIPKAIPSDMWVPRPLKPRIKVKKRRR